MAVKELQNIRTLTFTALMAAVCVALSYIPSIPIGDGGVRVTWGFLGKSVCGLVGGPITALLFGFVEDTVSYLAHPTGVYFPGYALTSMLGTMIYALFLYRAKLTFPRVFGAKLCTNLLNVLLGPVWSSFLYGKGYFYYVNISFYKNLIMLPLQTIMLWYLITALLPSFRRLGLVPITEPESVCPCRKKNPGIVLIPNSNHKKS